MSTSLNPHDAQQLLDRADKLRHSVAGFSLSWIGFVGICAGSALYAIGAPIWTTTDFPHAILLTTALAWILSFAVFSIVVAIRAGSAPRGFAIRCGGCGPGPCHRRDLPPSAGQRHRGGTRWTGHRDGVHSRDGGGGERECGLPTGEPLMPDMPPWRRRAFPPFW